MYRIIIVLLISICCVAAQKPPDKVKPGVSGQKPPDKVKPDVSGQKPRDKVKPGALVQKPSDKIKLGVVAFKEIGKVERGAGIAVASIIVGKIDNDKFKLVERIDLSTLIKEKLFDKDMDIEKTEKIIKELMTKSKVDVLLVGEISDLYNSFSVGYRILSLNAEILDMKDSIPHIPTWGKLKQELIKSLRKKGLIQKRKTISPAKKLGWFGEELPSGMSRADEIGVYIWQKDGSEMVYVYPGPFKQGENKADSYLPGYYIDRYEVTWAQYLNFCNTTKHEHPDKKAWSKNLDHPAVYVNWHDAKKYCEWSGKSLPTEKEWEKAARGNYGRKFPWGHNDPTQDYARYGQSKKKKEQDFTKTVGSYPLGISPYGCYDMAGNATEWCSDWFDPKRKLEKVMRGGAWNSRGKHLRIVRRRKQNPSFRFHYCGFRCVVRVKKQSK